MKHKELFIDLKKRTQLMSPIGFQPDVTFPAFQREAEHLTKYIHNSEYEKLVHALEQIDKQETLANAKEIAREVLQ